MLALFALAALAAVAQTPQNSATVWIGGAVSGASSLTTVGAVPYVSAAATLNQDATNFFYDSTNHRLCLQCTTPVHAISTAGKFGGPTFGSTYLDVSGDPATLSANGNVSFIAGGSATVITAYGATKNVSLGDSAAPGGITDGAYKLDIQRSGASGTMRVKDQTATTGATRILFDLGAADTSSTAILTLNGVMKFGGSNSTGAGSAALGANSPAVTLTAPYTWIKVNTSDGSVAYIPAWK
jgi:hypothetical protein